MIQMGVVDSSITLPRSPLEGDTLAEEERLSVGGPQAGGAGRSW